ncbi:MAG: tRNA (5-methylaminomethyl-2-thiouridine)(34)-methyltransferase MnmD [Bacteroidota bacterium]|nr:tRNA (5-methylaminomethyl-2-thiouridine)(34)-methyltransferase MnmD [Bacteroidota bacterium]
MNKTLQLCEDGSYTLFSEKAGECYHSIHGALTESLHIFINAGLRTLTENYSIGIAASGNESKSVQSKETFIKESLFRQKGLASDFKPIRILEIGFGTGLNALLTAIEAEKNKIPISYLGLEPFPISSSIVQQLNYCELLPGNSLPYFKTMHQCDWEKEYLINPDFNFRKLQVGFMEASLLNDDFDLIYFDAFSPEAQPDLWGQEVFNKCFRVLANDGILVTYCAKGRVKRALKAAGFVIENLPGPPGKREITRARKLNQ